MLKIRNIVDSFTNVNLLNFSLLPEFPLNIMYRFGPVSEEMVKGFITGMNKTNCLNDPIDVRLLDFDVVGNNLNLIFGR